MTVKTFRRHVPGTPAQAMAFLVDVERWPAWLPGLRVLHLSDRPVQAGAVWLGEHAVGRREVKFTAHALQVEPDMAFAYRLAGGGLEAVVCWSACQDGGRALVTQKVEVQSMGLHRLVIGAKRQFLADQRAAMDHLVHAVVSQGILA